MAVGDFCQLRAEPQCGRCEAASGAGRFGRTASICRDGGSPWIPFCGAGGAESSAYGDRDATRGFFGW